MSQQAIVLTRKSKTMVTSKDYTFCVPAWFYIDIPAAENQMRFLDVGAHARRDGKSRLTFSSEL